MNDKTWIDLALKYGGYMAQDRIFLENRLSNLTEESDKRLLVTPPASVLNAYFAELYQKRSPKDATTYFFELSCALEMFQEQPHFRLEGQADAENFRFIRLNLSGKSFGFCYKNEREEGIIFSEFPIKITPSLLLEIAQIFPHYLLEEREGRILTQPAQFLGNFEFVKEQNSLTELSENEEFMRLSGYNVEDLLEEAKKIGYFKPLQLQYEHQKFHVYISKTF